MYPAFREQKLISLSSGAGIPTMEAEREHLPDHLALGTLQMQNGVGTLLFLPRTP